MEKSSEGVFEMKVGIITIDKCNNFGAELQAFATQRTLQEMGYEAEIIDYLYFKNPAHKATYYSRPLAPQGLKKQLVNWLKYRLATKVLYDVLPCMIPKQKRRNRNFSEFHQCNTRMSPTYRSIDDLYRHVKPYDVYVVGSDQVWNPYTESNLAPYFLQFAPQKTKKISYASSFGVTTIPNFAQQQYREWLSQLDAISCREDAGVKIVKELTGKEAQLTLDPTLLLNREQWLQVKGQRYQTNEDYILLYEVHPSEYIQRMALAYASEKGLRIYRLCVQAIGNQQNKGIVNIEDAGPADFVHLFAHATLVLTNSFHGTAFACNFGRNFHTVLSKQNKKNSRMTSLLTTLKLMDRIVWEEDEFPKSFAQTYDVANTQVLLEQERTKSLNYLRKSIDAEYIG